MGNNFYGFKLDPGRESREVSGYELCGPIAIWGVVLVLVTLFLTSSNFGFYMWRSDAPVPALAALGLTVCLYVLAYIADDLRRLGLKLLLAACVIASACVVPLVAGLKSEAYPPVFDRTYDADIAYKVGAAILLYLGVVAWLIISRIKR